MEGLAQMGCASADPCPGISCLKKDGLFDAQALVSGKAGPSEYAWPTSLAGRMRQGTAERLIQEIGRLTGKTGPPPAP